jgi:hypothetical protein
MPSRRPTARVAREMGGAQLKVVRLAAARHATRKDREIEQCVASDEGSVAGGGWWLAGVRCAGLVFAFAPAELLQAQLEGEANSRGL